MTDGTGSTSWTYDSLQRLTSDTDGASTAVSYGYDLAGQLTTITYPGSHTVTRDYDPAGRIDYVTDWSSNKTTFDYDPDSHLLTETLPPATGVVDTTSYDNDDQPLTITDKKGSATLAGFTYTRDGAEQLATASTTGISEPNQSYSYNTLEQLTKSGPTGTQTSYTYDNSGDITQRNNTSSVGYDANGEACWQTTTATATGTCSAPPSGATTYTNNTSAQRTKATPSSGNASTYGYDLDGRLTNYASGSTTASYAYNGEGLRTGRTVNGTKTHFTWDLADATPLALSDGTNYYVYGPGNLPLEQIAVSGGTVTYLHHDQLGSTRLLTSSTGTNVGTYNYDPYGAPTRTGTTVCPLQYTGEYVDSESNLLYLRARYYDPQSAQFLTRDSLATVTRAPFFYGSDDPLQMTDPTGNHIFDPIAKGADILSGALGAAGAAADLAGLAPLGLTLGALSAGTSWIGAAAHCAQGLDAGCLGAIDGASFATATLGLSGVLLRLEPDGLKSLPFYADLLGGGAGVPGLCDDFG